MNTQFVEKIRDFIAKQSEEANNLVDEAEESLAEDSIKDKVDDIEQLNYNKGVLYILAEIENMINQEFPVN